MGEEEGKCYAKLMASPEGHPKDGSTLCPRRVVGKQDTRIANAEIPHLTHLICDQNVF